MNVNREADFRSAFLQLKPVCDQIVVCPTSDNLEKLSVILKGLDCDIIKKLECYILVPLSIQLSNKHKDDVKCDLLKCLVDILEIVIITQLDMFLRLYTLIVSQILTPSPVTISEASEELKLQVLKCVVQLVNRSDDKVKNEFFSRKYHSKLSIGVFLCTKLARNEKFHTLKVEALNCLLLLTQVTDGSCKKIGKSQVADVVMLMLPGIASTCLGIVSDGDIQNHKVIVMTLCLWSKVVGLVMSYETSKEQEHFSLLESSRVSNGAEISNKKKPGEFADKLEEIQDRDDSWIKQTDKKLSQMTKLIVQTQNHQHWRVRLELANSSYFLLNTCGRNLSQSVGYLIEALTVLSQDDHESVSETSIKHLSALGNKCKEAHGKNLLDIVEENFYSLLTRLPRILRGKDITLKEKELILVCGYFDILGHKHVPAVLSSVQHLNRFIHCLIVAATLDCKSVTLLEEVSVRGVDSNIHSKRLWRNLKNCESEKCEMALKKLCRKLVKYSDIEMLINSLLDTFSTDFTVRKEITILFVFLFSSESPDNFYDYSLLVKDVVNTLMESSLWNANVNFSEDGTSKKTAQENVVQVCLLAEAIGHLAVSVGPDNFSSILLQCLYPVLECAGSPLSIIACAGQMSLRNLASMSEAGAVSILISKNVDYLSHHVMLKLRKAHRNPRVLSVLSVIMDYSTVETLPSLHEIINDVLVQSCDMFQGINGSAYLQVFHTYLTCISRWTTKEISFYKTTDLQESKKNSIRELLEYKNDIIAAERSRQEDAIIPFDPDNPDFGDLSERDLHPNEKEEDEQKPKLPDYIKLTIQIMNRSLHFLPGNHIPKQVLVLQILAKGAKILSPWTDELNPVVHKIWSPLVERFKSSNDPLLIQRAFSLLEILASTSKDFIRSRTMKEVMPSLCKVLKSTSEGSKKRELTGAYSLTQAYKLQLLLLSGLGELCRNLELVSSHIQPILFAATPYLNSKQPSTLQEACVSLFKELGQMYPDLLWVHLMTVCPNQVEFKLPDSNFPTYKLESSNYEKVEYENNVSLLLRFL